MEVVGSKHSTAQQEHDILYAVACAAPLPTWHRDYLEALRPCVILFKLHSRSRPANAACGAHLLCIGSVSSVPVRAGLPRLVSRLDTVPPDDKGQVRKAGHQQRYDADYKRCGAGHHHGFTAVMADLMSLCMHVSSQ